MTEQWQAVADFDDYEVSDCGNIRSRRRPGSAGGLLKGKRNTSGHLQVELHQNGMHRTALVHVLVLEAFAGPRPQGMEGRHLDDDKGNNQLSNLAWGTRSQNMRDRVANGRDPQAARSHCDRGHEFSGSNLIIRPEGGRRCRACKRQRERRNRRVESL